MSLKYNLLPLLILLFFINCNNIFTSTVSETITIECTADNLESNYHKIHPIISAVDQQEVEDDIFEKFPEIESSNLRRVSLSTSKIHKVLKEKKLGVGTTVFDSKYVQIGISINSININPEQLSQIMKTYKEHIKKILLMNNIIIG